MKYIFYAVLFVFLLEGCHSTINKDRQVDNAAVVKPKTTINPLAQKFEPFLKGVWIPSKYIADIERTKSPLASQLAEVSCFYVSALPSNNDSLHIGYSLGNHEGADFILFLKQGQNLTSLKTSLVDYDTKSNFYDLGYKIKNGDTSLFIYHYNKQNKLLDSVGYTRVANRATDENDMAWGIQFITNKKLMAGRYAAIDSLGSSMDINFTNEGKVSGFHEFKNYEVLTDFSSGIEDNMDQVGFYQSDMGKAQWFAYKFNLDTLNLYEALKNDKNDSISQGKLKYKLVKQK